MRAFQIAGVALNGIARPGDIEESLREMKSIDNLQYHRIFGLLVNVNRPLDLFGRYNVDKIFELRILSVDSKYRGKGLAKQLFVRSEMLAQEKGFKVGAGQGINFKRICCSSARRRDYKQCFLCSKHAEAIPTKATV